VNGHVLELTMKPFQATLIVNGQPSIVVNGKNMFHFEHQRNREGGQDSSSTIGAPETNNEDRHGGKKIVGYWEDGITHYYYYYYYYTYIFLLYIYIYTYPVV
jgi:hypothetical protein